MTIDENLYFKLNQKYFLELKDLVKNHPRSYFKLLKAKYVRSFKKTLSYLYEWICEVTPKLKDEHYLISTKVNWILNGRIDFPKCEICEKQICLMHNIQLNSSYPRFCNKCIHDYVGQKAKESFERHQIEDPCWYDKVDAKRKATNLKMHGNPKWNNMEKNVQTCLNRYGVDNVRKTVFCKQQIKQTKKDKYGNENYVNVEKAKITNHSKRGVDWPMQDPEVRKKSATKYLYDNKSFDSKGELCYYIWLTDKNMSFQYQPNVRFKYSYSGKDHWYMPDFLVEGQYIEIKGDQFFKEDGTMQNPYDHLQDAIYEAKHQCMLKNNVKILRYNEYNKFVIYVNETYGNDFIKKCK